MTEETPKRRKKTPADLKREKYARYMRQIGTPLMITPEEAEEVSAHCNRLYARGMSWTQIAATAPTSVADTTVRAVVMGSKSIRSSRAERGQDATSIHRDTYESLMQTYYVPPTPSQRGHGKGNGRKMDATGVRRRIQALVADGFGYGVIAEVMAVSRQSVHMFATATGNVYASTYGYVVPVFEKLEGKDPSIYGATQMEIDRAKATAARHNWAPSVTWDEDTIDDPEAFPEWTGRCGFVQGYLTHLNEEIHLKVRVRPHDGRVIRKVLCEPAWRLTPSTRRRTALASEVWAT